MKPLVFCIAVLLVLPATAWAQNQQFMGPPKPAVEMCPKITYKGGAPADPTAERRALSAASIDRYEYDFAYSLRANLQAAMALGINGKIDRNFIEDIYSRPGKRSSINDHEVTIDEFSWELFYKKLLKKVCDGAQWQRWWASLRHLDLQYLEFPVPYMVNSSFKCGQVEIETISSCDMSNNYKFCYNSYVTLDDGQDIKDFFLFDGNSIVDLTCYQSDDNSYITLVSGSLPTLFWGTENITIVYDTYHFFRNTEYIGSSYYNAEDYHYRRNPIDNAQIPGFIRLEQGTPAFPEINTSDDAGIECYKSAIFQGVDWPLASFPRRAGN
ncbi:MAG: hypothetical protein LBV79_05315 [Candidatus Adiutrix sp.]|jgi:hypothetical protein|nr:hypothetical protein [Candidatus Adiutrix sp.]